MSEKMYRMINGETFEIPEEEVAVILKERAEQEQAAKEKQEERDRKCKCIQDKLQLTDEEMLMILNQ